MASTGDSSSTAVAADDYIKSALAGVDQSAPLTVDVIVRLMQAQSKFIIDTFSKQLSEKETIIKSQTRDIQELRNENVSLRAELDELQQYSRRNAVRISGIPEAADEKPDDVYKSVKDLLTKDLKVKLDDRDFCRMHRVGRPRPTGTSPRQIILKFTSYAARRRVMKARKQLKDVNGPHRLYINEDLTRKRAALAKLARDAKGKRKIKDTWVYNGKIFLKLKDDSVKVVTDASKLESAINGS